MALNLSCTNRQIQAGLTSPSSGASCRPCGGTGQRIRHGLSLVEVLVSMLLVGIVLVASLNSVGGIYRSWDASQQVHDDMLLAQHLMAEIVQQPYSDSGAIGDLLGLDADDLLAAGRSGYDDVDDYDGWSSAPQTRGGDPLIGYEDWTLTVAVRYARISDPNQNSLTDQGLKRITLTVTRPGGEQTELVGYRSKWGMLEQAPVLDQTVQTYVTSELQVGTELQLHAGGQLLNDAGGS